MDISRKLRRLLQADSEARPFERLEFHYERCRLGAKLFYLLSAMFAYSVMPDLHRDATNAAELDLLWPVMWLDGRDFVLWADTLSLATFLLALVCWWNPDSRLARLGFALALLLCGAFFSSFAGITHRYHAWFWMALVLAFLPRGHDRPAKLSYCLTFATAQALLLMFYSLAGFWKVSYGVLSLWNQVEGNFSPRGLALTLAGRMLETGTEPLLGPWFVENYMLAWPLFIGLIYIQLVSIMIAYRPRLHVAWGLLLIAFHTGTWLLMEIVFDTHVMLLLALMVLSPFRTNDWFKWTTLRDLPFIGRLAQRRTQVLGPGIVE